MDVTHLADRDPVRDAVAALRDGRPVLVVDDVTRENEGDVILPASLAGEHWVAWTVRHTSGLLCAPMPARRADELGLPLMVARNEDPLRTAYTVSVDARAGVTTGISAHDRARTARVLADPATHQDDLIRPGHVFPLRARPGGVLERPGHTEAAVDLCLLAWLPPVALIAEVVRDDGSMMRGPELDRLARDNDLPLLSIAQLAEFRRRHDPRPAAEPWAMGPRVRRCVETVLPTPYGSMRAIGYRDLVTGADHLAVVAPGPSGSSGREQLVRVHSECLTGETFHSLRCDCGPQLDQALQLIGRSGGALVYLRGHEGRGIGLLDKLAAYRLQDKGMDTIAANLALDRPADAREYGAAAAVLHDLGLNRVRLLTNNPDKVLGLSGGGVTVVERVPLVVGYSAHNAGYLRTKRDRMGHLIPASDTDYSQVGGLA